MSQTTCPVCGKPDCGVAEIWGQFRMRKCRCCGLKFCDPMVYDRASYDDAYARSADGESTGERSIGCAKWLAEASPALDEAPWMLFEAARQAVEWICANVPLGGSDERSTTTRAQQRGHV